MIRVLLYITFYIFGVTLAIAQIKSEEILIKNNNIELPGTLTYTKTKIPLIIWVHGSGNIDRNGNQKPLIKSNYIKQIRDSINLNNIAFFSFDKRTSNFKNKDLLKKTRFKDFVLDLKQVVHYFKDDKRFSKIILAGHSQGSLIAMMALKNVDKYISIAGAGETIDKTLVKQISKQNKGLGDVTKNHFKELKEKGKIDTINPFLMNIFAKQNQLFLKSWVEINPIQEIKKVKIPTLIINGDKDIQVQIKDAQNLKAAKPDAEFIIIKNMNHVLKDIQKDENNFKSYTNPNFPISKEFIKVITKFTLKLNK